MKSIRPATDENTARARLERKRFKHLRRCLGTFLRKSRNPIDSAKKPAPGSNLRRPLPYVELVWLPYYRVTIEATRNGKPTPVDTVVGGHDGSFVLVRSADIILEMRADHEAFPPAIDEARAKEIARNGMTSAIMRTPGWRARPAVGRTCDVELIQYPFWVYYFRRCGGSLDIKVLDAVSGEPAGPKVKIAMLDAFVGAKRSGE